MRKETIFCDVCKAEGALACYFTVDRRMDPAGSMDDVDEYLDLCPKHQWGAYKLAEQLLSYENRQKIYEAVKAKRARI